MKRRKVSDTAETGWSKDDPRVDGVYWWRADRTDLDPDIHSVVNGRFYEIGETSSREVENFGGEWLGPITASDFEQLTRLREAESETLEQIAERLMWPTVGKVAPAVHLELVAEVFEALRNRDKRAARIIKEHRESDVCRENCWTTITREILGEDGNSDAQ